MGLYPGTEQFASNFVLANCPDMLLLPWSRYCSYNGVPGGGDVGLYHFYGTYRFTGGLYARLAEQVIRSLG